MKKYIFIHEEGWCVRCDFPTEKMIQQVVSCWGCILRVSDLKYMDVPSIYFDKGKFPCDDVFPSKAQEKDWVKNIVEDEGSWQEIEDDKPEY